MGGSWLDAAEHSEENIITITESHYALVFIPPLKPGSYAYVFKALTSF